MNEIPVISYTLFEICMHAFIRANDLLLPEMMLVGSQEDIDISWNKQHQ